jgi:tol-pal system protein YbgF
MTMRPGRTRSARPPVLRQLFWGSGAAACMAAALLAASGGYAQSRPSLSDRVAALEARMQQSQTEQSVEQLNRIAQLESDVKAMRSLIEQMQNENEELKQRDKALYTDLDSRLSRIENAATAAPATSAGAKAATSRALPPPMRPVLVPGATVAPPASAAASGTPATAPAVPANPADEQSAYDAALAAVRADQYADSANRFNAFVRQFPDSPLAPNAYYWMGESYYVTQNYQLALEAFKTVVTRYPDSPKTPGAMLKLGFSQDGLKQRDAAQATLRDVIQKYPNSSEAGEADSRLRAMSMDTGGG